MTRLETFQYIFSILLLAAWPGSMELQSQSPGNPAWDEEYNLQLDRAIGWQQKADSLYHISVQWRKQAARMDDPLDKGRLQGEILVIEDSMKVYRERADGYFARLGQVSSPFVILDTVLHGISIYKYNLEHDFFTQSDQAGEQGDIVELQAIADTGLAVEFEIYRKSVYNSDNPYKNGPGPGAGTFYRIQLAVFSKEIAADHFGGLFPVSTEIIPEKEMTRYFVGRFNRLEDAEKALQRVRSAGYPDAYVVGYFNGVRGTLEKLRTFEKE